MNRNTFIFLVIISLFSASTQDVDNNDIEVEKTNLYKEAASEIKREQARPDFGGMINTIMKNGGSEILGSLMSQYGEEGGGNLLQGLGSLFANSLQDKKSESDSPDILESLGGLGGIASLVGTLQAFSGEGKDKGREDGSAALLNGLGAIGALLGQGNKDKGDGTAALLQGLGSLLGQAGQKNKPKGKGDALNLLKGLGSLLGKVAKNGKKGQSQESAGDLLSGLGSLLTQGTQGQGKGDGQTLDVDVLGSVLNYLTEGDKSEDKNQPSEKPTISKESDNLKSKESRDVEPELNMNDILSLASNFFAQTGPNADKNDNFLSLIPSILQTLDAFNGPEAENRARSHEGHSSLMPPILEKLHVMFDHFIHSDVGERVIKAAGAEKSFRVFLDDNGRFSYKKFGELMENHSYRRQWIRIVTDRIAEFLQYNSDPKVFKSYYAGAQIFFNSYLKNQGFPKKTLFDAANPVETISAFLNYASKKYFDIKIDSKEYVKPAIKYVKDIFILAEKSGTLKSLSNSNELSSKLADTINLEIIEPLAKVNRAYRFIRSTPKCVRYVLCLVNEENPNEVESLPGLKKLLYKGSSLLAGWFLSEHTGTPFWTLYTDITENRNCKKLYSTACDGFHAEEIKVTTEYVHNEL